MRVGLDLRYVSGSDRGYRRMMNLVSSLDQLGTDFHFELISEPSRELDRMTWSDRVRVVHPGRRLRAMRRPLLGRLRSGLFAQPDLMHFLTGDVWTIPSCPTLVTLHDLAPLALPEMFFRQPEQERAYRDHIETVFAVARRVVTVSNTSRDDLIRRFPSGAAKLRVIPQGVAPEFTPEDWTPQARLRFAANLGAPEGYLFYCGGIDPRKNLELLLDAYGVLLDRIPNPPKLLLAGPPERNAGSDKSLRELVHDRRLGSKVVLLGWISDSLLRRVYSGAELFLFPSRMEGFGYAPLEAMACGCPVLCSNAAALPETVGEAARLISPEDPEHWAYAMGELLANPQEREQLRRAGLDHVKRFSWDQCASEFLSLYREILGTRDRSGP